MVSIQDKFLSSHRFSVKSSSCGRLNVINSILLFNFFDIIFLGLLWFINYRAYVDYNCCAFTLELIFNTIITGLAFIGIINCNFIIFVSVLIHLVRFWHICHMAGKLAGLIIFNLAMLFSSGNVVLRDKYIRIFNIYPTAVPLSILRLVLIIFSLWYCLVLHRIRASGGSGTEFKSAEELEMESMDIETLDNVVGSVNSNKESV